MDGHSDRRLAASHGLLAKSRALWCRKLLFVNLSKVDHLDGNVVIIDNFGSNHHLGLAAAPHLLVNFSSDIPPVHFS